MEQATGVPGDVGAGMGKADARGGFAGEVPGYGLYGDYEGGTANQGTGYWFGASDSGSYQGVWERGGCDSVSGWDGD